MGFRPLRRTMAFHFLHAAEATPLRIVIPVAATARCPEVHGLQRVHEQVRARQSQMKPAISSNSEDYRLSVAPMMDWTDSHCRVFHRLLAPHARLYTEMVHANAVLQGDRARLLARDSVENPVALQLGGSDPGLLAGAARVGQAHGFDEVISTSAVLLIACRPGVSAPA